MEFKTRKEWSFSIRAQLLACSNSGFLSLFWVPVPIFGFFCGNFLNFKWWLIYDQTKVIVFRDQE